MNTDKQKEEVHWELVGKIFREIPALLFDGIDNTLKKEVSEKVYHLCENHFEPKELPKQLKEVKLVDLVLAAAKYGFDYRDNSQHQGEVPKGNVLQWLQYYKEQNKINFEEVNEDAIADCMNTILKSSYETINDVFRRTVVPKEAITNAFNEYFGVKENEPEF